MFLIGFIVGAIIGACFGVLIFAMVAINSDTKSGAE